MPNDLHFFLTSSSAPNCWIHNRSGNDYSSRFNFSVTSGIPDRFLMANRSGRQFGNGEKLVRSLASGPKRARLMSDWRLSRAPQKSLRGVLENDFSFLLCLVVFPVVFFFKNFLQKRQHKLYHNRIRSKPKLAALLVATEKWERISRILTLINNPFRGQLRVKVSRLSTRRWAGDMWCVCVWVVMR